MTASSRARAERGEDVAVHGLLGLAAAELALDHDHVEVAREVVLLDLPPLLALVAVGDEGRAGRRGSRSRPSASGTPGKRRMRPQRWSAKRSARAAASGLVRRAEPRRGRARRSSSTRPSCRARSRRWRSGSSQNQRRAPRDGLDERPRDRGRRAPATASQAVAPATRPRRPSSRAACRPGRRAGPSRVAASAAGVPASAGAANGGSSGRHTARKLHQRQMRTSSVFSKFGLRGEVAARDPRGRPSSSAPTAGCARGRGRGSPRPTDAR